MVLVGIWWSCIQYRVVIVDSCLCWVSKGRLCLYIMKKGGSGDLVGFHLSLTDGQTLKIVLLKFCCINFWSVDVVCTKRAEHEA